MPLGHEKKITILQAVIPVKVLFYRLSVFFAISLAIVIIAAGKFDNKAIETVRTKIMDITVPVMSIVASPVDAYHSLKNKVNNIIFIYQENERLRLQNENLLRFKSIALELENENRRMREMIKFLPGPSVSFVTARVVGDTGGPYSNTAIISSGSSSGIKNGQIVTNREGLVGRISEIGNNSARILLVTDLNSKIPVIAGESGTRAILSGGNSDLLKFIHLPEGAKITVGEKIVTSGDGKFFPSGIPVGVVNEVNKDYVTVKPLMVRDKLDYISINDYQIKK